MNENSSLKCENCNDALMPSLKCGLILCDKCRSNDPSQTHVKCLICDSFHSILNEVASFKEETNRKCVECAQIINEINLKLENTKFEFENTDYTIKEYCRELRRQVQLTKEIQMQQIEELSDKMLNQIDKYESDSLNYSNLNKETNETIVTQTITKMKKQLDEFSLKLNEYKPIDLSIDETIEKLKQIKTSLTNELNNYKSWLFQNNKLLSYKYYSNSILNENLLGFLKYGLESQTIDYNQLYKIDFSQSIKSIRYAFDNLNDVATYKIHDTKFLNNNDLILLVERSNGVYTYFIMLIILDSNGSCKNFKPFITDHDLLNSNSQIYFFNNKICISYKYGRRRNLILILDEYLNVLNKIITGYELVIIGADNKQIYVLEENEYPLIVYNWSLERIGEFGQASKLRDPFFISNCFQICSFSIKNKEYLVVAKSGGIKILDALNGLLIKKIDENGFKKIQIDNDSNIVLFKKDKLVYYTCEGYFLKEYTLSDLKGESFYLNKNEIYYFDDKTFELGIF